MCSIFRLVLCIALIGAFTPVSALAESPGQVVATEVVAAEVDDDIPGAPLASLPTTGQLGPDTSDVYQVLLRDGDQIRLSIEETGGLVASMALFPRGSESVATTDPVAVSTPEKYLDYEVDQGGYYYLQVVRVSGSGDYSLSLDSFTPALEETPDWANEFVYADIVTEFSGSLIEDDVDCGMLWLDRGASLNATLHAGPTTAATLDIYSDSLLVGPGKGGLLESAGTGESLTFTAPKGAYYPLVVSANGTAGGFEVEYEITPPAPWGEWPDAPAYGAAPTFMPPQIGGMDPAAGDNQDMWVIPVGVGQTLDLRINCDSPNVSVSVQTSPWSYMYPQQTSPGNFRLLTTVTSGGPYYLYLSGWGERFTYTINRVYGPTDDMAPGTSLASSPVTGSLDFPEDRVDCMSLDLDDGDFLDVSLEASPGLSADLSVVNAWGSAEYPDAAAMTDAVVEALSYQADNSMQYIIRALAVAGAGDYTLSWAVRGPTGDDQVPGTPLVVGNSVTATSNATIDRNDVYAVVLEADKRYRFAIPGGAEYANLRLFGPESASVYGAEPIAYASESGDDRMLFFDCLEAGTYYLRVENEVTGSYTLETGGFALQADDSSSSATTLTTEATGTLDATSDWVDWYKVVVGEGMGLGLSLTQPEGADFQLDVLDAVPDPNSSWSSDDWDEYELLQIGGPLSPQEYFVRVRALSGSGTYRLRGATPIIQADDNQPGPMVTAGSPLVGTVSQTSDYVDCQRVWLDGGKDVAFKLSSSTPGDVLQLSVDGGNGRGSGDKFYGTRVPASGYYLVQVRAMAGAGDVIPYVLSWTYDTVVDPDDEIPGVPLAPQSDPEATSGVVTESVTFADDRSDVYRVRVPLGMKLEAHVSYPGPAALSVYGHRGVVESVMSEPYFYPYYADDGSNHVGLPIYNDGEGEYWYVQVVTFAGDAEYTLDWRIVENDDWPNSIAKGAPFSDTVDEVADERDYVSFYAKAGQAVRASLSGPAGTNFDLQLTGRGKRDTIVASGVHAAKVRDEALGASLNEGSDEAITAVIPTDGLWTFEVSAKQGRGAYTLDWKTQYDMSATLTGAKSCSYNEVVALTGALVGFGSSDASQSVRLYEQTYGSPWRYVGTKTTDENGAFAFARRVTKRTTFKVVYAGTAEHGPTMSSLLTVMPRAALTAPGGRPTYAKRAFTASGKIYPQHAAGTGAVKIKCQQYYAGAWHTRKTVSTRLTSISGGSKYAVSTSLPSKGRWRLVAYHSDASHAYTEKASSPFTVK